MTKTTDTVCPNEDQSSIQDKSEISQPAWEGKSKGSGLGYRIFIALLKRGGLGSAYALLSPVTLWYRLFRKDATRPLKYLYEERLRYPKAKSKELVRENLMIFGQTLIDKIAVLSGSTALTFDSVGEQHLNDMVARGEGGIIVSAHLGNWEVAGHMLKRLGTVINIVMYDGEAEQMKATLERYHQKRSFNIIYITQDLSHIYEISAALRRNELVCLHADRFRPGNRTFPHLFLGEEAQFPAGPFILASKLRAPVCFVFAFKKSKTKYAFQGFPSRKYAGAGMTGAQTMLEDYVALLEQKVKEHPEQWFNYFDFWKAKA